MAVVAESGGGRPVKQRQQVSTCRPDDVGMGPVPTLFAVDRELFCNTPGHLDAALPDFRSIIRAGFKNLLNEHRINNIPRCKDRRKWKTVMRPGFLPYAIGSAWT